MSINRIEILSVRLIITLSSSTSTQAKMCNSETLHYNQCDHYSIRMIEECEEKFCGYRFPKTETATEIPSRCADCGVSEEIYSGTNFATHQVLDVNAKLDRMLLLINSLPAQITTSISALVKPEKNGSLPSSTVLAAKAEQVKAKLILQARIEKKMDELHEHVLNGITYLHTAAEGCLKDVGGRATAQTREQKKLREGMEKAREHVKTGFEVSIVALGEEI